MTNTKSYEEAMGTLSRMREEYSGYPDVIINDQPFKFDPIYLDIESNLSTWYPTYFYSSNPDQKGIVCGLYEKDDEGYYDSVEMNSHQFNKFCPKMKEGISEVRRIVWSSSWETASPDYVLRLLTIFGSPRNRKKSSPNDFLFRDLGDHYRAFDKEVREKIKADPVYKAQLVNEYGQSVRAVDIYTREIVRLGLSPLSPLNCG